MAIMGWALSGQLCLLRGAEEARELLLDPSRVLTLGEGYEPLYNHLLEYGLFPDLRLHLARYREHDQVGHANAIYCGDKGDGYAGAELARVGEVFHDMDEAENGAEDSDSGGVPPGGPEALSGKVLV